MKREAINHPKMLDLAARLNIVPAHAVGIITKLLNWCADMTPQGNIGRWPDGAIAVACDWSRDPAQFVAALVDAGWVDRCAKHRLVFHDLGDHAEQWWKRKMEKLGLKFITAERTAEPSAERSAEPTAERSASRDLTKPNQTSSNLTKPKAARPKFTIDDVTFPEPLDTPEARKAATEWIEHKRQRREAYASPESFEKKLAEWSTAGSVAFVEAVNSSIGNNYQGIFAPRKEANGNRRNEPGPGQRHIPGVELGPV